MKRKIKISTIIIISIAAVFITIVTTGVFVAISEAKKIMKQNGMTVDKADNKVDKGKTINLTNFSTLVVTGKGTINIEQADKNSFQCFSEKEILPEIKNDTLFVPADGNNNYVNAVNLKTIILEDKVKADISEIKSDTFNIRTSEKSEADISNLKISVLNVLTEGNSKVELYDLTGNNIDTKLVLKDKSEVYIDNSGNLNLQIKKDKDAELEISN